MAIKTQYTVKTGDRITWIARSYNITSQEIINVNPQIFTAARIDATNKLIANGTIANGQMLLYAGEILNIPSGELDNLKNAQEIKADSADELTILIDGAKCPLPHEFQFIEYFDACSDSFSITYPYNPTLKNPAFKIDTATFKTKGLPRIRVYIGNDAVLSGQIEVPAYKISPSSVTQTIAGRSNTFTLEKSDVYPSIPREFLDSTLTDIAPQVSRPYGVAVEVADNVDLSEAFPKATIEDSEKPFFFLSRLARERSALLGKTGEGKLLIHKATNTEPVANFKIETADNQLGTRVNGKFVGFVGVQSLDFTFDTTVLFGQYIGKTSDVDDTDLVETVSSTVLNQQTVKITDYSDATPATLPNVTAWEEQKAVRGFYNNSIPFPDWINPNNGERWKAGQFITIQVPDVGITDPKSMMIRSVQFDKDSNDKRTATLNLIPSEVYL